MTDQLWGVHPIMDLTRDNLDFQELVDNYPCGNDYNPCRQEDGEPNYTNECAIRFSTMLHNAGYDISSFRGAKCWHCHDSHHFLRVEELLTWLTAELGDPEIHSHPHWKEYKGKKLIVVFQDFWARREGDALTGDHIDLLDKNYLVNGDLDYFERSRRVHSWELD